jgi:hypothetical protein
MGLEFLLTISLSNKTNRREEFLNSYQKKKFSENILRLNHDE